MQFGQNIILCFAYIALVMNTRAGMVIVNRHILTCSIIIIIMIVERVECPINRLQLIQSNKVMSSFVEHGLVPFSTVLSSEPTLSEGYFRAFDIPNIGHLVFDEDLVLIGLTTQGYEVSSNSYFASNFTFQYSNATDSLDFETYPTVRRLSGYNYACHFYYYCNY